MIAQKILQVRFLAENIRGQPQTGLHIQTPAIKVQIESVDSCHRGVHAIKTNDRVILIFGPHAALETSLPGFRQRCDIKYYAANLAKKLTPNIIELIVLAEI